MASPDKNSIPALSDTPGTQPVLRFLGAAWKRKSLLVLGIVLGSVGGILYYYQKQPVYQATTQLMVIKKRPETALVMGMDGRQQLVADDYVSSHVPLLKSPLIIERAVKEHDLGALESLTGKGDPVGLIIGGLTVTAPTGSSAGNSSSPIINLAYRSTSPKDCQLVLNAIVASYKQFLDETYETGSQETVKLINKATDLLSKDMKKLEDEKKQLRLEAPDFNRTKDGSLAQQDFLTSLDNKRSELVLGRSKLATRKRVIEDLVAKGGDLAPLADLLGDNPGVLGVQSNVQRQLMLRDRLSDLELEKQELQEKFGPDYSLLKAINLRIAKIRLELGQLEKDEPKPMEPVKRTPITVEQVTDYLKRLQTNLNEIDQELEDLKALHEKALKEYQKVANFVERADANRKKEADTRQVLNNLEKPLQQINLLKDSSGYDVKVLAAPGEGGKVEPRAATVLPLACFAGLLLGGAMAWLAEVSDRSFRSPQEIRQRLGLTILGHVPHFEPAERAAADHPDLGLGLCAVHMPKSAAAESFRGVRTALYYSTRGEGHQIIQVTSPSMGDGKSTLSCNLAISIIQAGKRVLLVDADFRRPRLHRMFNVAPGHGLANVLSGKGELLDAIQPSGLPNLDVLPCGPRPSNPADLLMASQFAEILETLRSRYDFIIVDTPPLLAVSDPAIVAPWVDGVVLAMRLSRKGRPAAERSVEMLGAVGATILGIVVNGFGKKGLEEYGYDYAYGYSYQYTSNYENDPEPESSPKLLNGKHHERRIDLVDLAGRGDEVELGGPSPRAVNNNGTNGHRNGAARRTPKKKKGGSVLGWLHFWG